MEELRRFTRWQINRQAKIKLEGAAVHADCIIKDINLKGLQVALKMRLPKDSFTKFALVLSANHVLDVEAWIVWHKPVAETNVYGFYFSRIHDTDKEKIYRFLRSDYPGQVNQQWWGKTTAPEPIGRLDAYKLQEGGVDMEKAKTEDRRVFARFPVDFPARFFDANKAQEVRAKVCDISAKGICLSLSDNLEPRTSLEIWLDIPDKCEPLYTRGEVIWSKISGNSECRSGISLEKADLMGLARVLRCCI